MPKPTIDDVAKAVIGRLAAGVVAERFDIEFTPRFSRKVKFDLQEDAIDVVVIGFSRSSATEARDTDGRDYRISIGIGKVFEKKKKKKKKKKSQAARKPPPFPLSFLMTASFFFFFCFCPSRPPTQTKNWNRISEHS